MYGLYIFENGISWCLGVFEKVEVDFICVEGDVGVDDWGDEVYFGRGEGVVWWDGNGD